MENLELKIIKITAHSPEVKTFRLSLGEDMPFKPGQYLILTLEAGGKEVSKPLSISSSPTEKGYIEFTKKLTQSPFSGKLDSFKAGDTCRVRLPIGRFTFEGEFERIAFLSGGIGVTPIRSMVKNAVDSRLASEITLLYSSRVPGQLIFKDDFDAMAEANPRFKVIYTLTDCPEDLSPCRKGRIDAKMVAEEIPDYAQRRFYICGPPAMVGAMRRVLSEGLSVPHENIVTEDFFGY
jgi:ferredoxin-NADP reductase